MGLQLAPVMTNVPSPIEHGKSSPVICTVQVRSEPAGADVELDGAFVGNTPTTLRLKPGDYMIVVKKKGYDEWKRKLTAIEGNEHTVRAELTKTP